MIYLQKAELNRETVYPMHPSSIHGVEDMSTLAELHEAAIMHNLLLRYQKDNIYVSTSHLWAHLPPWGRIFLFLLEMFREARLRHQSETNLKPPRTSTGTGLFFFMQHNNKICCVLSKEHDPHILSHSCHYSAITTRIALFIA